MNLSDIVNNDNITFIFDYDKKNNNFFDKDNFDNYFGEIYFENIAMFAVFGTVEAGTGFCWWILKGSCNDNVNNSINYISFENNKNNNDNNFFDKNNIDNLNNVILDNNWGR